MHTYHVSNHTYSPLLQNLLHPGSHWLYPEHAQAILRILFLKWWILCGQLMSFGRPQPDSVWEETQVVKISRVSLDVLHDSKGIFWHCSSIKNATIIAHVYFHIAVETINSITTFSFESSPDVAFIFWETLNLGCHYNTITTWLKWQHQYLVWLSG